MSFSLAGEVLARPGTTARDVRTRALQPAGLASADVCAWAQLLAFTAALVRLEATGWVAVAGRTIEEEDGASS